MNLERAIAIAVDGHRGAVDKAGAPYILHPLRVMMALSTEEERIVGVLHDVPEDTATTFDDLRREGFSEAVLTALAAVTKTPADEAPETATAEARDRLYFAFVARAAGHPIARRVKIADIRDNLDASRMNRVTPRDAERLDRYVRALRFLETGVLPDRA